MDQAMVKRGIGAVVLAIIAALLLGYLLKDKSRERQEVVDMKLPDTTELNIPDLGGMTDSHSESSENSISLVDEATNAANSVKNTVVASVDAVTDTISQADKRNNNSADINNPGFSIRPPAQNETREIVDNNTSNNSGATSAGSAAIAYSTDPVEKVIASTKKQETKKFKPTIVEEKKKPTKKTPKQVKAKDKPAPQQKTTAKTVAKTAKSQASKYSIQLLATSSQSRAGKLAKTMKSEGYTVFITETKSNNKILFRVRIGGHVNRADAVKAQEGMKRRYQKNFFVQNSLVVSN